MSIYIDSANLSDIEDALRLGYVKGVTTNPIIMARERSTWRELLKEICNLSNGRVYYQIDETDDQKLVNSAKDIYKISPNQIILKLPASPLYFPVVKEVCNEIPCCMTAVYTETQLIAACKAGARQVAVYVNRITKNHNEGRGDLTGDGPKVVESMREFIEKQDLPIEILAASLKSPREVFQVLMAGAHYITTTLDVLKELAVNPLSEEATIEFNKACAKK